MSWSVSASGPRAVVKQKIEESFKFNRPPFGGDQVLEFERARVACHSAVDSLKDDCTHVSLSASGHYTSVSMSISGWREEPKVETSPVG